MVEYRGYCRPLKGKVDFEVEAVNSFDTVKGVKWQVKGTHNDYNISVFTSEGKAKELLTLMAEKNIHEAEDIIITYDMEELIPYPLASEEKIKGTLYEMEELIPYPVAAEEEEEDEEDEGDDDYGAEEIPLQTEGLDPKYLKKDGTPDLRYKASREWVKSQETTEMVEVSVAPHMGLNLEGPPHLAGMVDVWESEGVPVENKSSFEAETKEFVPFIGATRVIPKAVYYQMALHLPQSVSVTPTQKGESIILGFHEQDYSRVEGLINAYGIPEGGPKEEEGISMFQAEAETNLPLPAEWAEDLSNFSAENIPLEAEEFYGEETEVMSLDEYYSNVMDFKDSDTVNVDFAGNVIVKSNEGGIYDGEEFEAPLEPDHICITCGNLLQEFTHNCINPSHTHPVYGCMICDDVCSFCDKQTQIESFNSPSREDWLYYCQSCGVQNSKPTSCHACGSDEVKIVVMASDNLWEPDEGEVAGKYECYCSYCAGVVDLEADACPHCGTVEFKEFDAESFDAEYTVEITGFADDIPQTITGTEKELKDTLLDFHHPYDRMIDFGLDDIEDEEEAMQILTKRWNNQTLETICDQDDMLTLIETKESFEAEERLTVDELSNTMKSDWIAEMMAQNLNWAPAVENFYEVVCGDSPDNYEGEDMAGAVMECYAQNWKNEDYTNWVFEELEQHGCTECRDTNNTIFITGIYQGFYCPIHDPDPDIGNAESFKEWSEEELKEKDHPDKDVTFDNWLDEEIEEHGDVKLSVWKDREHEEKEHQAEDDWEDFEEGTYEDDWEPDFPEVEDKPKLSTVATIVGIGALATYLAPNEIKNMLKKLR